MAKKKNGYIPKEVTISGVESPDGTGIKAEVELPNGVEMEKNVMINNDVISQEDAHRFKEVIDNLRRVYEDNPEMASVVSLMASENIGFLEAVASIVSPEELKVAIDEAADGTPFFERLSNKKTKRESDIREAQEAEEKIVRSWENVLKFCQERGLSEEETEQFEQQCVAWFNAWADGELSKKDCEKLFHMVNYEVDIDAAYKDGMNAGRSEKVKAIRASKADDVVTAGIGRVGNGSGDAIAAKLSNSGNPIEDAINMIGLRKREL